MKHGCPVAIEVFDGNVADPAPLANQVKKLKERFALERVVLVGDRGMITEARIEEDRVRPDRAGAGWQGRLLVRAGGAVRNADNSTRKQMFRVHPFSCAAQLKPPTHPDDDA
jgi:hypothetical protein